MLQYRPLAFLLAHRLYNERDVVRQVGTVADAEQEAVLALMRAAEIWDEKRGVSFMTYAYTCIAYKLIAAGRVGGVIRVPERVRREVREMIASASVQQMPADEVCGGEYEPPAREDGRVGRVDRRDEGAVVRAAVQRLDSRSRTILRMRFGLGRTKETHTLTEVSRHLGVSRERVRQIQIKAMRKLREILGEGFAP